mmetsp:Transcript_10945/g.20420  ORF Transcript_10945/g.20420 Transcript_10945/m.20420 type:complete len:561 (+) Transcript_10945:65-1747(+)
MLFLALAYLACRVHSCRAQRDIGRPLNTLDEEHRERDMAPSFGNASVAKGGAQKGSLALLLRTLHSAHGFNPSGRAQHNPHFTPGFDHASCRTARPRMQVSSRGKILSGGMTGASDIEAKDASDKPYYEGHETWYTGYETEAFYRRKTLGLLTGAKEPESVEDLIQELLPLQDRIEYNVAINAYARSRLTDRAFDFLQHMKERGIQPDSYTYGKTVLACREGKWEKVQPLLNEMRKEGEEPIHYHHSAALNSACHTSQWQQVLIDLEDHRHSGELLTHYYFKAGLAACKKGRQWERAISMLDEMREVRVMPIETIHRDIITVCGQCDEWEQALKIFEGMPSGRPPIEPGLRTYEAMMNALDLCKKPQRALSLLDEACEKIAIKRGPLQTRPNYKRAMSFCSKRGLWQRSLQLFSQMEAWKLRPDYATYNILFQTLEDHGQWQQAMLLLFKMHWACKFKPDNLIFKKVINTCEYAKQWEKALSMFNLMHDSRVHPALPVFQSVLSACENSGHQEKALSVLVSHLEKSNNEKWANLVREKMEVAGMTPNKINQADALRLGFE